MPPLDVLEDVSEWNRFGAGKSLQFIATDDEVQEWLLVALPKEYAPYWLVGADLVCSNGLYFEIPFSVVLTEFLASRSDEPSRSQFFILSRALTPNLPLSPGAQVTRICALNGLVALEHGGRRGQGQDTSAILLTDRVRHAHTAKVRDYADGRRIFNSLRRHVQKRLVYSTMHRFADGSLQEDCELIRMTAGAAEAYQRGFQFAREPGRLLTTG